MAVDVCVLILTVEGLSLFTIFRVTEAKLLAILREHAEHVTWPDRLSVVATPHRQSEPGSEPLFDATVSVFRDLFETPRQQQRPPNVNPRPACIGGPGRD